MADWNARYRDSNDRLFGDAPNEYVREVLGRSDVAPASALCLGDGDGRNGGWLAARGMAVTAVDISDVAVGQARGHDAALGVSVERIVADLADWTPDPARRWDAVFMMYLQCESAVRLRAAGAAAAALAPGGWFVAEGFRAGEDAADGPGPRKADLLYELPALIAALPGLRVVEALEGAVWLDEGRRHQGPAQVARLLARRV